jgi:PIN domain nuclease of toxin-antitoxin system
MEELIHVDTHVLVWLYAGDTERFPKLARERLEAATIVASPLVVLELQYLHEIKRIAEPAARVVQDLAVRIGLEVDDISLRELIAHAEHLSFTRDPFDRLIVAHAAVREAPLLTADKVLHKHYRHAIWDRTKR